LYIVPKTFLAGTVPVYTKLHLQVFLISKEKKNNQIPPSPSLPLPVCVWEVRRKKVKIRQRGNLKFTFLLQKYGYAATEFCLISAFQNKKEGNMKAGMEVASAERWVLDDLVLLGILYFLFAKKHEFTSEFCT
jgi:hypothetical protein